MFDGYLTTSAASLRCGLSRDHVRRLLERGTLNGVKIGRDWFVMVESLDSYMAHRPKPGPKPKKEQLHEP